LRVRAFVVLVVVALALAVVAVRVSDGSHELISAALVGDTQRHSRQGNVFQIRRPGLVGSDR
jgi:hypothetical protein